MFQRGTKFIYVLEVAINRSKANVGDLINLLQSLHDEFADFACSPFALRRIHHKLLHIVHDVLHLAHGNRTLFTCPQQPRQDFLSLKLFSPPIFFHYHVWYFVNALISGETLRLLCSRASPLPCHFRTRKKDISWVECQYFLRAK